MNNQDLQIDFTFRHITASDAVRDHLRKKLDQVLPHFASVSSVHVVLSASTHHHQQEAEIVVHTSTGSLTARAETHDLYQAIDQAVARLDAQGRRNKGRAIDGHRQVPPRREGIEADQE